MAEYRLATQSLVLLAQRDLADFWGALRLEGDPTLVRDAVEDFLPELMRAYGDASALLGADWYDMLRDAPPSAARFAAALADTPDAEQVRASARWAVGGVFRQDPDAALSALSGATQRLVMQPFRDTVFQSGDADPFRPRFARVPVGVTCRFCTMVASRGFVYASADTAGAANRWHDNCNCMVVPGYSPDDYPEGYDVEEYRRLYREGSGIGRDLPADS